MAVAIQVSKHKIVTGVKSLLCAELS